MGAAASPGALEQADLGVSWAIDAPEGAVTLHSHPSPLQELLMVFLGHPLVLGPAGFRSAVHAEPWTLIPSKAVPACSPLPGTAWHLPARVLCAATSSSWVLESRDGLRHGCVCVVARGCTCPSRGRVAQAGAAKELFFPVLGQSSLQVLHWERSGWMFKASLG